MASLVVAALRPVVRSSSSSLSPPFCGRARSAALALSSSSFACSSLRRAAAAAAAAATAASTLAAARRLTFAASPRVGALDPSFSRRSEGMSGSAGEAAAAAAAAAASDSAAPSAAGAAAPALPRLVLHFDVNKTILMNDPAGGRSQEDMLNTIVADTAWGGPERPVESDAEGFESVWRPTAGCAAAGPSSRPPSDIAEGQTNFFAFLKGVLPEQSQKKRRNAILARFTAEGQPGAQFRGTYEQLDAALRWPTGTTGDVAAAAEAEAGDAGRQVFAGLKYHVLIPAFFRTLEELARSNRDFRLVIRTFGDDVSVVVDQLNAFCEGKHPMFPDVRLDGTQPSTVGHGRDYRIQSAGTAAFYRRDGGHCAMVVGAVPSVIDERTGLDDDGPDAAWRKTIADTEARASAVVLRDVAAMDRLLNGPLVTSDDGDADTHAPRPTMAVRDFYPYWWAQDESMRAGKLFMVDPDDRSVLPVFFDDNILLLPPNNNEFLVNKRLIVDVRQKPRPASDASVQASDVLPDPIDPLSVLHSHLFQAEPLDAVLDPEYFLKKIAIAEAAKDRTGTAARM